MKKIDMHGHVFPSNLANDKKEILKTMEKFSVDQVYISAIELSNQVPSIEQVDAWNRCAYDFAKEEPGRVLAYCRVCCVNANAADVAKRGLYEEGAIGLKLLSDVYMNDHRADPVIEEAIRANAGVLIHASYKAAGPGVPKYPLESHGGHIADLARRYPQARIVMAHLGGDAYRAIRDVEGCSNVSVDISGSLMRAGTLEYAVKHLGAERVVFGSDFPYVPHAICAGKLEEAQLTEEEKELIWYKNALRIFTMEGR